MTPLTLSPGVPWLLSLPASGETMRSCGERPQRPQGRGEGLGAVLGPGKGRPCATPCGLRGRRLEGGADLLPAGPLDPQSGRKVSLWPPPTFSTVPFSRLHPGRALGPGASAEPAGPTAPSGPPTPWDPQGSIPGLLLHRGLHSPEGQGLQSSLMVRVAREVGEVGEPGGTIRV